MTLAPLISFLKQQMNIKKILTIGGTISVSSLILVAIVLLAGRDLKAEANDALNQSDKFREQARSLSCELIGELTSQCFSRKRGACGELENEEHDYEYNFGGNAQEDCFQYEDEAVEEEFPEDPNQPIPLVIHESSDPNHELFRGDE